MKEKLELMEMMEQKGLSVANSAEAVSFNPTVLGLYLVKDSYPAPNRIMDKLESLAPKLTCRS